MQFLIQETSKKTVSLQLIEFKNVLLISRLKQHRKEIQR